jgi:hypothetical protein
MIRSSRSPVEAGYGTTAKPGMRRSSRKAVNR